MFVTRHPDRIGRKMNFLKNARFVGGFAALSLFLMSVAATRVQAAGTPPVIGAGGIVNVASNRPPDQPGGDIAQGSMFAIYGVNIGPANGVIVSEFPLNDNLAGVGDHHHPGRHDSQCHSDRCLPRPDQCDHAVQRTTRRGPSPSHLQWCCQRTGNSDCRRNEHRHLHTRRKRLGTRQHHRPSSQLQISL